ncbi:MAG TPA: DUF1361 domain-containing protein [Candidatus Saccharimonadales bacterium]|nr:DUF1361 domain-containing protein [Candidatus Saccharimonadales bacterium]
MSEAVGARGRNCWRIVYALCFSSLFSVVLLVVGSVHARNWYLWFLAYNLVLAVLPALLVVWLIKRLKAKAWLSPVNIVLTLLWLALLPNSFYMISDLIHTQDVISYSLLYQVVVIFSFAFNALVAGYISLYLIHKALIKRFNYRYIHVFIALVLFACSFAIYLGRYLRWNSWDIIVNPGGLLFDVSDTIISPKTHPEFIVTTLIFFGLLSCMYIVIWQISKVLERID